MMHSNKLSTLNIHTLNQFAESLKLGVQLTRNNELEVFHAHDPLRNVIARISECNELGMLSTTYNNPLIGPSVKRNIERIITEINIKTYMK